MNDDLNKLAIDLQNVSGRVGQRAATVVRKAASNIEATAKLLAPVDTGNLRASIGTDFTGDGRHHEYLAEIGPTAEYGAYVEFGTSRHAPQAFMGPALDRHSQDFVTAMEQITEHLL